VLTKCFLVALLGVSGFKVHFLYSIDCSFLQFVYYKDLFHAVFGIAVCGLLIIYAKQLQVRPTQSNNTNNCRIWCRSVGHVALMAALAVCSLIGAYNAVVSLENAVCDRQVASGLQLQALPGMCLRQKDDPLAICRRRIDVNKKSHAERLYYREIGRLHHRWATIRELACGFGWIAAGALSMALLMPLAQLLLINSNPEPLRSSDEPDQSIFYMTALGNNEVELEARVARGGDRNPPTYDECVKTMGQKPCVVRF
jgi:hypothetical protein